MRICIPERYSTNKLLDTTLEDDFPQDNRHTERLPFHPMCFQFFREQLFYLERVKYVAEKVKAGNSSQVSPFLTLCGNPTIQISVGQKLETIFVWSST